jgi:hypothetical protein
MYHLMLSVRVPLVQAQQLQQRGQLQKALLTLLDLASGVSESLYQKRSTDSGTLRSDNLGVARHLKVKERPFGVPVMD